MQNPLPTTNIAYKIVTNRLVIRCYNPSDAILLHESIQESVEHLKPWMPWAHEEPQALDVKIQRIRGWRAKFDLDQEYVYGIFNKDETKLIGGTGLHPQHFHVFPYIEIGYWINVNEVRKGYCTEAVMALLKVGFDMLGLSRLEIHCDPENIASAAVPRKLGFTHDATLRKRVPNEKGELKDRMIWSMLKDEYNSIALRDIVIDVYDSTGRVFLTHSE
jgi:RimJ/RimL family protein N-acetyltransferase